jgi:hypothetical protein
MKTTVKQITAGAFLAVLLLIGNTNVKGSEIESLNRTMETTLKVENWMMDETVWETKSLNNYEVALEAETNVEIGNLMTSENAMILSNYLVAETEAGLEMENWMTCEKVWNLAETEVEAELSIESWMVNSEVWK